MSGFNYSKWDNIELSDDEDDLHPNIDKESWFRMKHRSRVEREDREDEEMRQIEKIDAEDNARLAIITAKLNSIENGGGDDEDAEFEDVDALKSEADELMANKELRSKRVVEIKERRKWNIDNICKVVDEKTVVSSGEVKSLKAEDFTPTGETEKAMNYNKDKKAAAELPAAPVATTKEVQKKKEELPAAVAPAGPKVEKGSEKKEQNSILSYNDYVLKHEDLLEEYSEIEDMEKNKKFLFKHCDILLHEHSQSYMLLSSLEDQMNGKKDRMKLVSRQSQILSHIQELGGSMQRDPRDVVLPFFERIEQPEYFKAFNEQVDLFIQRIKDRAVVKRKEMDAERRKEQGVELGPGGLDPFEVLEELPQSMRDAFDSQDIGRLQTVLQEMELSEAQKWMKKCVDSGLWNPGGADEDEAADGKDSESERIRREREVDPID